MMFRLGNRKAPVQQTRFSYRLPIELHNRILTECIDDPLLTSKELTALRLVCKQFDEIIAFKMLFSLRLFRKSNSVWTNLLQLEAFLSSKQTVYSKTVKTLQIPNWYWTHGSSSFVAWNDMPNIPAFILLNILCTLGYLCKPFILPHTMPRRVYKQVLRFYARLRLGAHFKPRLNLPEVKQFIWKVETEPDWVFDSTVRILQQLPQLDELVLDVNEELPNLNSFIRCVSKLNKLRKLTINVTYHGGKMATDRRLAINKIGKIIAANPNLTHLELDQNNDGENIDLVYMFGYIPKNRPLKLEHIGIHNAFYGAEVIIPHIRPLNSFHFYDSRYVRELLAANIFPPVMSFRLADEHTIEYLDRHPRITGLSFPNGGVKQGIFEIMARHSKTLTEYRAYARSFHRLSEIEYEKPFLRCTNLKRIVLQTYERPSFEPLEVTPEMGAALSVFSRLESSPNVVFAGFGDFKGCQEYCRESNNPFVQDLVKRMVYDGPRCKERSS